MNKPKVFISYAREDGHMALELHHALEHAGCSPWLDTLNLLPGHRDSSALTSTACPCRLRFKHEGAYYYFDQGLEVFLGGKKVGSGTMKTGFDFKVETVAGDHHMIMLVCTGSWSSLFPEGMTTRF